MTYEEKQAIRKAIFMCDMNVIDGFYYTALLKALDEVPTEGLPKVANIAPYTREGKKNDNR